MFSAPWRPNDMTKPDKVVQSEIKAELVKNSADSILATPSESLLDEKSTQEGTQSNSDASAQQVKEVGGPKGLEPTRYGDWESKGRCYDF